MPKLKSLVLVLVIAVASSKISKRVLPTNENCDPQNEVCRKGDWTARHIADCEYDRSFWHPLSCDAQNDDWRSWTVDVAEGDRCIPATGTRFACGQAGTSTRCVCSDTNLLYNPDFNECRCQYWPDEDPGVSLPAPCIGYYDGGRSTWHHWACCNNCNNPSQTCDGETWQGGSDTSYCGACGLNTGGGKVKYYFNCGSCSNQQECSDYCSGPIRSLPGLCWQWLDCFQGCCLASTQQPSRKKRQIESIDFCGDGTCSEGESPTTCPTDCCYQLNSDCAPGTENLCERECCGHSRCCVDSSSVSTNITGTTITLVALAVNLMQ